ncbi:NUDIX domain-containing protein [Chloroflexi bacterium TSY]|nr:NUDIX domain-containing protein [Chloroflexi bacterium TSY]
MPFRHGANGPEFLLLFNLFFEQWQFPRGGIKNDESAQTCALREFSFETGLTVKNLFEDSQTVLDYTTQIRGYNLERTIVYYLGEILPGEVTLGNENHCEARWLSADQTWELLTETSPEQLPALMHALAYTSYCVIFRHSRHQSTGQLC